MVIRGRDRISDGLIGIGRSSALLPVLGFSLLTHDGPERAQSHRLPVFNFA